MSVKIHIHPLLHHLTDNHEAIDVKGDTVGDCLRRLVARFPEARKALFNKDGKLLGYIDIFVNGESSYPEELAKPVKDGDELHIVLAIAGG